MGSYTNYRLKVQHNLMVVSLPLGVLLLTLVIPFIYGNKYKNYVNHIHMLCFLKVDAIQYKT